MPFKSKAQKRYLYANEPEIAKEFEAKTPKGAKLPEKVAKEEKSDIGESFMQKIDNALGLSEGVGAASGPTFGPEGVTKGSAQSNYGDARKTKKKNKKIKEEVLEAG